MHLYMPPKPAIIIPGKEDRSIDWRKPVSKAMFPFATPFLGAGGVQIGTPTTIGSANLGSAKIQISTTAPVAVGQVIWVAVQISGTLSVGVSSVSDGGSNTYTLQQANGGANRTELWAAIVTTAIAAGTTITIIVPGTVSSGYGVAAQCSGIAQSSPLDSSAANAASVSIGTSASITTASGLASGNEIVIGVIGTTKGTESTFSPGSGFTTLYGLTGGNASAGIALCHNRVSSNTSVTFSPSWSSTGAAGNIIIAPFKGA